MPPSRRELLAGLGATGAVSALGASTAGCWTSAAAPPAPWSPSPRPLADTFRRGMNLAHLHRRGWGYGSDRAHAQVRKLRAMGVRDLAVNPFAYTRSLTTPEIRWGDDPTLTDDDLRAQVAQARDEGMRVLMKPHLWSWQYLGGSGNMDLSLDADGWREWFRRYTAYAVHHARLAAETGCDAMCVGLEYTSASRSNPGAWAEVARACRQEFGGALLYAANWYEEAEVFADWGAFDLIGINAYYPLSKGADTSVDALVAGWQPHLDAIEALAKGRPVVFPEAGYRAVRGATERPWEDAGGDPDPELQARAYEALLRAATARSWFQGLWWWKWFTDMPGEGDPFAPDAPAQAVLQAWYRA